MLIGLFRSLPLPGHISFGIFSAFSGLLTGDVIAMLTSANMTHKEGYGPIFRTSIVYPFVGMVVCIALCMLIP